MAVQARSNNVTVPLIKEGISYVKNGTIKQDAGRTVPLLYGTVMAYDVVNALWVPFVALTNTHGESVPQGIYLGDDIAAADLVDDNIADCPILVGGSVTVDEQLIVWDQDTQNADSVINAAAANPYDVVTAEACLRRFGIFIETTVDISQHEN